LAGFNAGKVIGMILALFIAGALFAGGMLNAYDNYNGTGSLAIIVAPLISGVVMLGLAVGVLKEFGIIKGL